MSDMPLTFSWEQQHNIFAERLNNVIQNNSEGWEPYSDVFALFYYSYDNHYQELTKEVKYRGNVKLGNYLGRLMAYRMQQTNTYCNVDMVIPVPLHWTRLLKRGHNQAETIAAGIANMTGARLETKLLYRARKTASQATLTVAEKAKNVSGAFKVNVKRAAKLTKPTHILIVDDVFTTGATMGWCHKALRDFYGNEVKISCAAVAGVR